MSRVEFVDTSVLLNLLRVPGKDQHGEEVRAELRRKTAEHTRLFVPATAVVETGNHVEQLADGRQRRRCAEALDRVLRMAFSDDPPWRIYDAAWDAELLESVCDGAHTGEPLVALLSRAAMGGGDVTILAEALRYKRSAHHRVEVRVWTYDRTLRQYGDLL